MECCRIPYTDVLIATQRGYTHRIGCVSSTPADKIAGIVHAVCQYGHIGRVDFNKPCCGIPIFRPCEVKRGGADVSELQVVRLGAFGLGRRAQDDGGIAVQGYPPGGVHTCVKSTVAQGLGLRSPRDYKCREEQ